MSKHITNRVRFMRTWRPGRKAAALIGIAGAVVALGGGIGGYALAANTALATRTVNGPYSVCTNGNAEAFIYNNNPKCVGHPYELNGFGATGARGPAGPAGPTGPAGSQGPAGVETVTVPFDNSTGFSGDTAASIPAGKQATLIAACSSGQVDFSGGYALNSASLQVLQNKPTWAGLSNPTPTTTPASGWEVIVQNNGTTAASVNVWAICGTLDG